MLHGTFKRAKRVWGLTENPASADVVGRPKVVYSGEFDTLDRNEIERLAEAAETPQDAAIYKTAAFTGLWQGELLALRWEHVDLVSGLLHVRRNFTNGREKVPKGKRVCSVPMMPEVIDTLAQLKEREHFTGDDDLVFPREVGEHLITSSAAQGATTRLWTGLACAASAPTICGTSSAPLRPRPSTLRRSKQHGPPALLDHPAHLHHRPRREDAVALAAAFGIDGDSASAKAPTN